MTDDTNAVDLIMSAIKERTVSDSEFRDALIKNPKETLEAAGIDLADCDAINIIDGEPNHLNIVLPPAAGAVSDSELDSVVGGAAYMKRVGYDRMLPKLKVDLEGSVVSVGHRKARKLMLIRWQTRSRIWPSDFQSSEYKWGDSAG